MKKISLVIIIFQIFVLSNSYAVKDAVGSSAGEFSKVGGAGSQFLKIGVGARATSMAGAYCSVVDDLSSIH